MPAPRETQHTRQYFGCYRGTGADGSGYSLVAPDLPEDITQIAGTSVEGPATRQARDVIQLSRTRLAEQYGEGADRIGTPGGPARPAAVEFGVRQTMIALSVSQQDHGHH